MKRRKKSKLYVIEINKKILLLLLLLFIAMRILMGNGKIFETFNHKSGDVIVVDPGHGGIDGGTSDGEGLFEKDINLDVGLKLKKELKKEKFNVIMTREVDESLEKHSKIKASRYKRDLNARKTIIDKNKPKVFVSIHVNSSKKSSARGIQVYYFCTSNEGKKLAECICQSVDKIVYKDYLEDSSLKAKAIPENFFVLRETESSGVLIEIGFITNAEDKKLLKDNKYKKKVVLAITEGIKEYIE